MMVNNESDWYGVIDDFEDAICDGFAESFSDSTDDIVWLANVVCIPAIAAIGLVCNGLNVLILLSNRTAKRMPSWTFLLALAACDCFFLLFATFEVMPNSIASFASSPSFNRFYAHTVLYVRTLASTFYKTSVLIVVAFNVERYVSVCRPLHAAKLCTKRASRLSVFVALAASFALSVQWPICYRVVSCYDRFADAKFFLVRMSEDEGLRLYFRVMDYVAMLGFNVLPIMVLCVLNGVLVVTLRRVVGREQRRRWSNDAAPVGWRKKHSIVRLAGTWNANAMLFAVVLMFFVCLAPQVPARILFDKLGPDHPTVVIYMSISQQLVFLNAALNFCLYCLVSRRYRRMLRRTVKKLGDAIKSQPVVFIAYKPNKLDKPLSFEVEPVDIRRLLFIEDGNGEDVRL